MSVHLSYTFEKDELPTSPAVRVITRNRDDGDVPPSPGPSYFPTFPDDLREFLVVQYLGDSLGESFVRIATLADLTTYTTRSLDTFEDATADFVGDGVLPGDVLDISILDPNSWTSDEYPSSNPFQFSVLSVISATQLQVAVPFPAFATNLTWAITARSISGTLGKTRRNGSPVVSSIYRDSRFNRRFLTAVDAENYVAAAKADIASLVNDSMSANLVDETATTSATV